MSRWPVRSLEECRSRLYGCQMNVDLIYGLPVFHCQFSRGLELLFSDPPSDLSEVYMEEPCRNVL